MNVFLFLGCSFTWGEGLQYYSELPSVIFHTHHTFDSREITYPQYQFIKKNRFARLVADRLNGIEIVTAVNGGNHTTMTNMLFRPTEFIPDYINGDPKNYRKESFFNKNEITHIVIQFTDVYRDNFESCGASIKWNRPAQHQYCIEKGISAEEFEKDGIRYILRNFKKELEPYIELNVKFAFLMWRHKFWYDVILEEEFGFFKNNLIEIQQNNNICYSIDGLTNTGKKFTIHSDFCEKGYQCGDAHLSLEGHKIIAESIIKKFSN